MVKRVSARVTSVRDAIYKRVDAMVKDVVKPMISQIVADTIASAAGSRGMPREAFPLFDELRDWAYRLLRTRRALGYHESDPGKSG